MTSTHKAIRVLSASEIEAVSGGATVAGADTTATMTTLSTNEIDAVIKGDKADMKTGVANITKKA